MKSEREKLIHELLGIDSNRETVLAAGNRVLRRRRQWRADRQMLFRSHQEPQGGCLRLNFLDFAVALKDRQMVRLGLQVSRAQ